MNQFQLVPDYKSCTWCNEILTLPQFIDGDYHFYCSSCFKWVNWRVNTLLSKSRVSYCQLQKLFFLFIENKSPNQALISFQKSFSSFQLNKNTVYKYFKLFGDIAYKYYQLKVLSTFLNGAIEIDETVVFRQKKTRARRYRKYKLQSMWLLGMIERESKNFIIVPIKARNDLNLMMTILKYVSIESTIYTDCHSVYVNNRRLLKESRLISYGYNHHFIDHSVEFVAKHFPHIHTNTIERLWRSIKSDLRAKRVTVGYLKAIGRFYFHKTLSREKQIQFIRNYINNESCS